MLVCFLNSNIVKNEKIVLVVNIYVLWRIRIWDKDNIVIIC